MVHIGTLALSLATGPPEPESERGEAESGHNTHDNEWGTFVFIHIGGFTVIYLSIYHTTIYKCQNQILAYFFSE